MTRCLECGTKTAEEFCSDECYDLWRYGVRIDQRKIQPEPKEKMTWK